MKMYIVTYVYSDIIRTEEVPAASPKEAIQVFKNTMTSKYGRAVLNNFGFRVLTVEQAL